MYLYIFVITNTDIKTYKPEEINDYITNTEIEVVRPCDEDGKGSFTKNDT